MSASGSASIRGAFYGRKNARQRSVRAQQNLRVIAGFLILRLWRIHDNLSVLPQIGVLRVFDHADNLIRRGRLHQSPHPELELQRVLSLRKFVYECLVDDGHIWRAQPVVLVEIVAHQERRLQRLEVPRAHVIECRYGDIVRRIAGRSHKDIVPDAVSAQGHDRRGGGGVHAGDPAHAAAEVRRKMPVVPRWEDAGR